MTSALTSSEFEEKVLRSSLPVLIDFWAEWCGPCKAIAPHVEEVARLFAGKLTVFKVDVDAESELAIKLGIMSIPTLVLFKDGREVDRIVGFQAKDAIAEAVKRILDAS
ncbi:MAG: thioredoxin [Fimbriimonadales bacterium]|jgi:thioredoxin 1|nr:thioredoxin [Fimbriimonadales bacterium]